MNFKSGGIKQIEISSQGTYNFQIVGNETLIIADYKYAKNFKFAMSDIKLQLKDDNILYQVELSTE